MSELSSHQEALLLECLERVYSAFRNKDEELWKETQHPKVVTRLGQLHDGIYLDFLMAFQVHSANFPSSSWKALREFSSEDSQNNTFHEVTPSHVLEYEIVPSSDIHKPLNEQLKKKSLVFALIESEQARIVPKLPNEEDLEFARKFLEKRRESSVRVDQCLRDMKPELRDQLLAFQIQREKPGAMRFLMAQQGFDRSESQLVVEKVWASRPIAE